MHQHPRSLLPALICRPPPRMMDQSGDSSYFSPRLRLSDCQSVRVSECQSVRVSECFFSGLTPLTPLTLSVPAGREMKASKPYFASVPTVSVVLCWWVLERFQWSDLLIPLAVHASELIPTSVTLIDKSVRRRNIMFNFTFALVRVMDPFQHHCESNQRPLLSSHVPPPIRVRTGYHFGNNRCVPFFFF